MKSFCSLAIIFGVVAISMAALTPEQRKAFEKTILDDCKSTVAGATDDDVNGLLAHELPTTPTGKCLGACAQEKLGMIVDGKFSTEGAKALGAKKYEGNDKAIGIFNEMVDECSSVAGDDKCELSFMIFECMHNGAVKRGYDPKEGIKA